MLKSFKVARFFKCLIITLFVLGWNLPSASALVLLMYHRFDEPTFASTHISLDLFKAHIKLIKDSGYQIVPLSVIEDAKKAGQPLPDKTVAITIDDAYLSLYEKAWPFLKQESIPFALFISTATISPNSPTYMNFDQLRELRDSGLVTFGGHGDTHESLVKLSNQEVALELLNSQKKLKDELGIVTPFFSYPYGEASLEVMELVRQAGYQFAFGQQSGALQLDNVGNGFQNYYMPRFPLNENYGDIGRFELTLRTLPLPIEDALPISPFVGAVEGDNPPLIGFTVANLPNQNLNLARLQCFSSNGINVLSQEILDRRVEVRLDKPFESGRTRINCTMPTSNGRWYWYGMLFTKN